MPEVLKTNDTRSEIYDTNSTLPTVVYQAKDKASGFAMPHVPHVQEVWQVSFTFIHVSHEQRALSAIQHALRRPMHA